MVLAAIALVLLSSPPERPPVEVRLVSEDGKWSLLREEKPYFIKGAAGDHSLSALKEAGGNSTRTWDAKDIGAKLDEAQRLGMTVTVGFWLGHKGHGFNYNDPEQVRRQYEDVKANLLKWRTHPAVLMWALGNEMEINHDVPEVWRAVGHLAKMVKSIDDKHPVATVVADITESKVKNLKQYAPDVDVLGINTYGGCPTIAARLKAAGWTKPYMITEFGPLGPWESPKTSWGAAIEATSSQKAAFYSESYRKAVAEQPGWCLGSYAFLWGDKQETTPTWFGMILSSGEQLETVDVIIRAWTGRWPTNRAPQIQGFSLGTNTDRPLAPVSEISSMLTAVDPDGDKLTYKWELRSEVAKAGYAGEGEIRPGIVPARFHPSAEASEVTVRAPLEAGAYRVYVYVFDGKGKAATANAPLLVKAALKK